MDDANEDTMKDALSDLVRRTDVRNVEAELGTSWENLIFRVEGNDFQTVKIQLKGLGLITQSQKRRSVSDAGTYWTLTPYGDTMMTRLRAILRPS